MQEFGHRFIMSHYNKFYKKNHVASAELRLWQIVARRVVSYQFVKLLDVAAYYIHADNANA